MHSNASRSALRDILQQIDLAFDFVADLDQAAFIDDTKTVYAVIRCLEIISEASRRLGDDLKARHPSIAWKNIAGAGNVYRHNYENIVDGIVWDTVQLALPPLRAVIEHELNSPT